MNDQQKDAADRLIRTYVTAGLELLAGLGQIFRDLEGKSSVKEACSTVTQMETERTSSKPETEEAEGDEEGGIDI